MDRSQVQGREYVMIKFTFETVYFLNIVLAKIHTIQILDESFYKNRCIRVNIFIKK